MRKVILVMLVLAVVFGMAQTGFAADKAKGTKPGAVVLETVSGTATVSAIDAANRTVTLKFADGATKDYKLGPEVKNFDQIKVGDVVKATYVESAAVFVRKSSEKPAAEELQTIETAPKGAKPGVLITDTVEITAKVEAIDYAKRTVTLKGPQGNVKTLPVDKSVKRFKNVKVGDEVVVRYTEAMAITVEKP